MPFLSVLVGELLFSCASVDAWRSFERDESAREKRGLVRDRRIVAIDTRGRLCIDEKDFLRAQTDGTFPVKVYSTVLP